MSNVAYTVDGCTANITALETALARNTLTVEYADRRTTYRSTDDILKAINYWRNIRDGLLTGRSRQALGVASKGFA